MRSSYTSTLKMYLYSGSFAQSGFSCKVRMSLNSSSIRCACVTSACGSLSHGRSPWPIYGLPYWFLPFILQQSKECQEKNGIMKGARAAGAGAHPSRHHRLLRPSISFVSSLFSHIFRLFGSRGIMERIRFFCLGSRIGSEQHTLHRYLRTDGHPFTKFIYIFHVRMFDCRNFTTILFTYLSVCPLIKYFSLHK